MKLAPLAAVVAAALALSTTSLAATKRWSEMTLRDRQAFLVLSIHRDKTAIGWWRNHQQPKSLSFKSFSRTDVPFLRFIRCDPLGVAAPAPVCSRAEHLARASATLDRVRAEIAAAALPAHDALWECLRPHEASDPHNRDTGRNGHYGGLQMTPGWYGGQGHLASDDPWIVQKQEAEKGYAASGFSSNWLWGQWGETLGYCRAHI